MEMKPTLYLIRGLPGSGKTTIARELFGRTVICSYIQADDYMIDQETGEYQFDWKRLGECHSLCQSETDRVMGLGMSVAVANTFTTHKEMKPYYHLATKHGYQVVQVLCEGGYTSEHDVPQVTMERMEKRFER